MCKVSERIYDNNNIIILLLLLSLFISLKRLLRNLLSVSERWVYGQRYVPTVARIHRVHYIPSRQRPLQRRKCRLRRRTYYIYGTYDACLQPSAGRGYIQAAARNIP